METSKDNSVELEAVSDKLEIKDGDIFKVEITDNTITFKKQPPKQIWEGD